MSAPYMQFYVADYLGDTRHLTTEQHGAYLLLLMTMWRSDGVLPNDDKKLARIVGCTASRWARIKGDVLEYFEVEGGALTNARLTLELEKASEKSNQRAEAGSRGGTAKALKDKERAVANAKSLPCHSSEPEPDKNTPIAPKGAVTKSRSSISPEAQAIWAAAPTIARQRSSLAETETELAAAIRRGHTADQVTTGLAAAYASTVFAGEHAKGVHRLIAKDRWASFATTPAAAKPAAVFDGPPELRAMIAGEAGEENAAKYVDPARWHPASRTLIASNSYSAKQLTGLAPKTIARTKINIDTTAPAPTEQAA